MKRETYHEKLKENIDCFVHTVYKVTKNFPKNEIYGVTSQFRRSALSVMLNYIEGYARNRPKVHKNFLEISYGSLKETQYLIQFSFDENYLSKTEYDSLNATSDEIAAMLWGTIKKL